MGRGWSYVDLQVAVDESPQLWWQHAGRAVLAERAQVDTAFLLTTRFSFTQT